MKLSILGTDDQSKVEDVTPLNFISYEALIKDECAKPEWLIEPLICAGDRVLVFGESGHFKSWLLLHLALHLSTGQPWFDKFECGGAPKKVLVIDAEMSRQQLRSRIMRLAKGIGINSDDLPLEFISRENLIFTEDGVQRLCTALNDRGFDPDVVLVDTFRRVFTGNENEAKDVNAFWRDIEPLNRAGRTLIFVHHMKKPNKKMQSAELIHRASGSTDIIAGVDSSLAISRSNGTRDIGFIQHVKCRAGEEYEAFNVKFVEDNDTVRFVYEATRSVAASQERKHKVLQFLDSQPDKRAHKKALITHLQMSFETLDKVLQELGNSQSIFQQKKGKYTWVHLINNQPLTPTKVEV